MTAELSKRQRQVLDFVAGFIARRGYSPSLQEIAVGLGLSSVATVHQHVAALVAKGALRRPAPNRKRGLKPADSPAGSPAASSSVPLVGVIAAGRPIEALETIDEIEIPESYLSGGECFALRVRGDSMIEDGIRGGDVVVVRRQSSAQRGQTVVAVLDGEATLKKFYPRGQTIELRPANETMASIIADSERVEIRGVVVSLLRQF